MKKLISFFRKIYISHFSSVAKAKKMGVTVGNNCRLINVTFSSEPYLVTLGDHVSATNCHFETHDGGVWVFRDTMPNWDVFGKIKVGNNVFIGRGCTILPGETIGDNVVIGAGAVVTKNLDSNFIYAGVPARKIKKIEEYYNKISASALDTKYMSKKENRNHLFRIFK